MNAHAQPRGTGRPAPRAVPICINAAISNQLLVALPADVKDRWRQWLEPVDLQAGQVLYESGCRQSHAYFPSNAIVSLLYVTENGKSAEIAVVGREGVVGIALFMGGDTTADRAVVQSAGMAYRLTAQFIKTEFEQSPDVVRLLLSYTQALITPMAQTAVCNRHHSVDQQLCRWLLWSLDRLPGNEVKVTQEQIAHMLGVRREGVTEAALKLQQAGLISYSRGHITVTDRCGLEHRTCECYGVVKAEYERLLPQPDQPATLPSTVSLRTVGMHPGQALVHRQRYR